MTKAGATCLNLAGCQMGMAIVGNRLFTEREIAASERLVLSSKTLLARVHFCDLS